MFKKFLFVLSVLIGLQGYAIAKTVDEVFYSEQIKFQEQSLVLNGAGLRKILFVKVYAAGLYLPHRTQSVSEVQQQKGTKRMRLVLRRDVDAGDFVDALNEGLEENSSEQQRQGLEKQIHQLVKVMQGIGDVKKNDCVDFDYSESKGVSISLNNRIVGERIGGQELYNAVLRIWIGENAIDKGLKESLLNL